MHKSLNYAGKSILQVRVTTVKFSQVEVVTEDGRHGVIPEREWSWDQSIRTAPRSFVVGQTLTAVWLPEKNRGEQLYFSLRELENPWDKCKDRYWKGDYVTGEIVNIRSFGVFVQIEPGITAIIWNRDLPIFSNEIPADLLTIGDKLRGVITLLDAVNQKMELSVNKFLEEIGIEDLDRRAEMVEELFKTSFNFRRKNPEFEDTYETTVYSYPNRLIKLQKILILDDDDDYRDFLKVELEKELRVVIDQSSNPDQARQLIQANKYDIIISDIRLRKIDDIKLKAEGSKETGIEFADSLLAENLGVNLIFCSSEVDGRLLIASELEKKYPVVIPFVFKHKDSVVAEILEEIDYYRKGTKVIKQYKNTEHEGELESSSTHSLPLDQALFKLLQSLIDQEAFSQAFVLEVFPGLRKTALLAHFPEEQEVHDKIDFDALYFSPVRNVLETRESIYHREITNLEATEGAFKNLFPRYPFRSCMGAPVFIPGQPLKYVLYVLDAKRDVLSLKQREQILRTADQIGIAIERSELREVMIQSNENQNRGHLLGSLIHELSNKLPGIQESFTAGLVQLETSRFDAALKYLHPLQKSLEDLNVLFYAYSRLAHHQTQGDLNLNEVAHKAIHQLRPYAREHVVELYHDYDQKLPPISGYATQVEQVLVNLILNAVQHIEIQLERFTELAQHLPALDEHFNGFVHLSTRLLPDRCQIRILDSGPGIAYNRQKSIFEWGTSSRDDGQGMGLYISQNLAHSMGGKLYLADTIRFVGSLFVLEFPLPENH